MKKILILFLLISPTVSAQEKLDKLLIKWNKKNVPYISVNTLALPNTKAILLDAREEKEYKVSHIKEAIWVGYDDFKLKETIGIRSETIAYQLIKKGYTNVYNLYGGIFEWKNNNFQVIDSLGNYTDKIHTFDSDWSKWLTKGEKVYE
jgi:rhodanese-related sulfurtransferase